LLEGALESVFAQTVPVHQVLLVDDGSTDDTAQVVRTLMFRHPDWEGRFRYLHQDNKGKSAAINLALPAITGEWIAFNDSDDRWLPEKLALQFEALGRYKEAGACFADVRFVRDPTMTRTAFEITNLGYNSPVGLDTCLLDRLSSAPFGCGIYMQTMLVRASVMRAVGEFDSTVRMAMDADLVFRLGLTTLLCFVNTPLVEVDRTPERLIGLTTEYPMGSVDRLQVHEQLLTKWLQLVRTVRPDLSKNLVRSRSSTQSALANRHVVAGDGGQGRAVLRRALSQRFAIGLMAKLLLSVIAPGFLKNEILRRCERV
jgi:glycosyltransferase involved in cell wall biosynthesis